jgi:hypothetical protein
MIVTKAISFAERGVGDKGQAPDPDREFRR